MAKRRMFSQEIVNTDRFLDMSPSAQALYFHFGMHADDDGFIANPQRVTRMLGARPRDLNELAEKEYVKMFDSGVCMICDWQTNNHVRRDCYVPTRYQAEKKSVSSSVQNAAADVAPDVTENVSPDVTEDVTANVTSGKDSLAKDSIAQDRKEKERQKENADKPPRPRFSPPTREEVEAYCRERRNRVDAQCFLDFYTANGWTQGRGKPIRDWQAAVRTWERRDKHGRDDHRAGRNDTPIAGITRF